MSGKEFQKLVKEDKYQVFLFDCPANLPFSFARHTWFVSIKKGIISRWEILFRKNVTGASWGHLHLNFLLPFQGIETLPFSQKYLWSSRLLGYIEGGEESTAARMVEFIEKSSEKYPYCNRYLLIGPNSNTYVQWILNKFPENNVKLSWNSFGKNYK